MQASADNVTSFQERFHQRWAQLTDPHVRALAWLIDAPGLLDRHAPQWQGKVARLGADAGDAARDWLHDLERAPAALHAHLAFQPFGRLGRYAEKLMTFYLRHLGVLAAHNVQVRAAGSQTIGEFDFLVWRGGDLLHWEFATKFYLLESVGGGDAGRQADYFVGPNLAASSRCPRTRRRSPCCRNPWRRPKRWSRAGCFIRMAIIHCCRRSGCARRIAADSGAAWRTSRARSATRCCPGCPGWRRRCCRQQTRWTEANWKA
jgi:hypothetical protein